jgi:hypothetical protein
VIVLAFAVVPIFPPSVKEDRSPMLEEKFGELLDKSQKEKFKWIAV